MRGVQGSIIFYYSIKGIKSQTAKYTKKQPFPEMISFRERLFSTISRLEKIKKFSSGTSGLNNPILSYFFLLCQSDYLSNFVVFCRCWQNKCFQNYETENRTGKNISFQCDENNDFKIYGQRLFQFFSALLAELYTIFMLCTTIRAE